MSVHLFQQIDLFQKNRSLFEQSRSGQSLPLHAMFGDTSMPRPVAFEKSEMVLSHRLKSDHPLSSLVAAQQHIVLTAFPHDQPITKKNIAVLFSGGPAPGGHTVIAGIKAILGEENTLWGVKNGPKGLIEGTLVQLSQSDVDHVRHLGGFDLLGSDRTKIKTADQVEKIRKTIHTFSLDGIIVIGGDDSNTNAAFLAEAVFDLNCAVVGVPKTIDGDLQVSDLLPISFGFDTATKIYAEMVGNLLKDAPSSRKYWHFVKLMGRSASHVTLEVALQTHPQVTFISEQVAEEKTSLHDLISTLAMTIHRRFEKGMGYGVVLIPEGLIEHIPECAQLMDTLNLILGDVEPSFYDVPLSEQRDWVCQKMTSALSKLFLRFPDDIQAMLLAKRDGHGNVNLSHIPTESLLIQLTEAYLKKYYPGTSFNPLSHFLGYEGRCGAPSLFDSWFTSNLGAIAASLALGGHTGYMAAFSDLDRGGRLLALPIPSLMSQEIRHGKIEYVIEKAKVALHSASFKVYQRLKEDWEQQPGGNNPGPIQYWGETSRQLPMTVALNQGYESLFFKGDSQ